MNPSNTAQLVPVIVGCGRVGRSLARALTEAGYEVELRGREQGLTGLEGATVLLCVPDQEIRAVASQIGAVSGAPRLVGHTSGATSLEALEGAGADGMFSLHPLQTVPDGETALDGCPTAIAGSNDSALAFAREIAAITEMRAFEISESDRAIYHAAASIASNFLVTLEQTSADLLGGIAVENPREVLGPLVRRSLDNWLERGPEALTGPIARGDERTVELHRGALSDSRPELLGFYDTLAERTREIAREAR